MAYVYFFFSFSFFTFSQVLVYGVSTYLVMRWRDLILFTIASHTNSRILLRFGVKVGELYPIYRGVREWVTDLLLPFLGVAWSSISYFTTFTTFVWELLFSCDLYIFPIFIYFYFIAEFPFLVILPLFNLFSLVNPTKLRFFLRWDKESYGVSSSQLSNQLNN